MDDITGLIGAFEQELQTNPKYAHIWKFTDDPSANELILSSSNAFLYGAIADQQIKAERAWELPYKLKQRLGHLDPHRISHMEIDSLHETIEFPTSLHRHPFRMAGYIVGSSKHLCDKYDGDACRVWSNQPTATELQSRLYQFSGINQKISAMVISLLVSRFKVPIRDFHDSEVAVDRHVRRVLFRTGMSDGTLDDTISVGKEISPDAPGQIDFALFWIGKLFCSLVAPNCANCPLTSACQKRIKANLVGGLSEIQKTTRIVERAAREQIRFLERLERQLQRLTTRETKEGNLHQLCAYHGVKCRHQGKKGHPIRYILRTKDRTVHVRKADVDTVNRQLDDLHREKSLHETLQACQHLCDIVQESQKSFEDVEQIYDENL